MAKFLSAYKSFLDAVTGAVGFFSGLLVLFMGFMIFYEVICRSVFNAPTEWVMELSTYCLTTCGFLGMGVAYAGKKHIHVDILLSKLSEKNCTYLGVFTSLAGAMYALLFTIEGSQMVALSMELNTTAPTTLSTPLWIPQLAMPVGMLLLFLHLVYTFLENINKVATDDFAKEEK